MEPDYPSRMPEIVKNYMNWFQAAYGWNPFTPLICGHCNEPVPLMEVYRCYECNMPMHKSCCIHHCKESIEHSKKSNKGENYCEDT